MIAKLNTLYEAGISPKPLKALIERKTKIFSTPITYCLASYNLYSVAKVNIETKYASILNLINLQYQHQHTLPIYLRYQ